jgi:hypothetical protein
MNCAKHKISGAQWLDYAEGRVNGEESARIGQYTATCPVCREIVDGLQLSQNSLSAAARTAAVLTPARASQSRIWDGVRFLIRRAVSPAPVEDRTDAIRQLRSILVSMYGSATAGEVLKLAATRSSEESGEPFATNLGCMVGATCGDKAARLVRYAAGLVPFDRVA